MIATEAICERITGCRACGSSALAVFLDLGETPLADRLAFSPGDVAEEPLVPLELAVCGACKLVQIMHTVRPEVLFCQDYPYYSSISRALMAHFRGSAERLMGTLRLGAGSLVMEAASNDGYMLRAFVEKGIPVLGIDPAEGPASAAVAAGVPTMNTFFGLDVARSLAASGKMADLFLANNVLAHVADLNGFVQGIGVVLREDGVAVIECPYLVDLMEHTEFDTIYHQHLCYYSVHALVRLFARNGLVLRKVERTPIHGGSLRLFVGHGGKADDSVAGLLSLEKRLGLEGMAPYAGFAARVRTVRASLMSTLNSLRSFGQRVVGYGAAAKACTLMSYCRIGTDHLDYVADLNAHKHGRLMGGNGLEIKPVAALREDPPDYVLILAWNFAEEIMAQLGDLREAGTRFIVPIPDCRVV